MGSQLMINEKELTKLKKDNMQVVKAFRDRKDKKSRKILPQVCYILLFM